GRDGPAAGRAVDGGGSHASRAEPADRAGPHDGLRGAVLQWARVEPCVDRRRGVAAPPRDRSRIFGRGPCPPEGAFVLFTRRLTPHRRTPSLGRGSTFNAGFTA